MFRDAREANQQHVDALQREVDRLEAENRAMRDEILGERRPQPSGFYDRDPGSFSDGERVALGKHQLTAFPVWAAIVLHVLTLGIFSVVHFNRVHEDTPMAAPDDPSIWKGIGLSFVPYLHFYWIVFNTRRIADRLSLQYTLRKRESPIPRGFLTVAAAISTIPYLNIALGTFVWIYGVYALQKAMNEIAAMPPIGETVRVDASEDVRLADDARDQDEASAALPGALRRNEP